MLSRIADSLFWMNRYMERADGLLRMASTYYILGMDRDASEAKSWKPVLQIFTYTPEKEITLLQSNTEESLKQLLVEAGNENSLRTIINKARENARGAQDNITKEVWECINGMYHTVNAGSILNQLNHYGALEVMKELTKHSVNYAGTIDITMPRGTGWYFMSLGRYVERCLQTIAIIEKQLEEMDFSDGEDNDILEWRYLLLSLSGYELHLKTYRSSEHNYNVLHQVLINENFPRSVAYSFKRIDHYLMRLTDNNKKESAGPVTRSFGRLYAKVKFMENDALEPVAVQSFLKEVQTDLIAFSQVLVKHFFSYT